MTGHTRTILAMIQASTVTPQAQLPKGTLLGQLNAWTKTELRLNVAVGVGLRVCWRPANCPPPGSPPLFLPNYCRIIPKPAIRSSGDSVLHRPPFGVRSVEVVIAVFAAFNFS